MKRKIAVEWKHGPQQGRVEILNGRLEKLALVRGDGTVRKESFTLAGPGRLEMTIGQPDLDLGSAGAVITLRTAKPFSLFLRDVSKQYPIFVPEYGVAVTDADDTRCCEEIEQAIRARGLQSNLQRIESEPEETYDVAAAHTRSLVCPIWLGLSRDFRIFEVAIRSGQERGERVCPRFHGYGVGLPESGNSPVSYNFVMGRGQGCVHDVSRRLEEGVLPILHGTLSDEDMAYDFTAFVTLESSKLTLENLRGTHFLVADRHGPGHMQTPEQTRLYESLLSAEMERDEETVLFFRAKAVNRGRVPRYAWFKNISPSAKDVQTRSFDGRTGFGAFGSGRVFAISKLNNRPLPQEEIAVLVEPGASAVFDFVVPHRPISKERAERLFAQSFEERHRECRRFWEKKLATAAQVKLPEKRIDEMVRAGLLHLDIITYGLEPAGTCAPTVGVYCPIGSESAPIIQFMDSMGWHALARRSLAYFLDKQHEDGFMQNFGGYMLETGAVLWSIGEHYRYTSDRAWVKHIAPKLLKSCEYLLRWRGRNQKKELRGRGYGMLDGKVADPEDPYHIFMLNGYAYLGLSRVAEMLTDLHPAESKRLSREADGFKKDIRTAFSEAMARSPVVPLGDGTWCPTAPPWAEARGPVSLFVEEGMCYTHGTFTARDSLLGPLYLVLQEVIEPDEQAALWMITYLSDLFHQRQVALSQPYYSPHALVHLLRGEVKPFLKAYYNSFSGLADRETYTFWEHYSHVSPHKTHEEGWFLMQTRWMLYKERGKTLHLLPGIPRAWLASGRRLELRNVATYFGPASLRVESKLDHQRIEASVACTSDRKPDCVLLRLPHPEGKEATSATGGTYDPSTETVRIEPFDGQAEVSLLF